MSATLDQQAIARAAAMSTQQFMRLNSRDERTKSMDHGVFKLLLTQCHSGPRLQRPIPRSCYGNNCPSSCASSSAIVTLSSRVSLASGPFESFPRNSAFSMRPNIAVSFPHPNSRVLQIHALASSGSLDENIWAILSEVLCGLLVAREAGVTVAGEQADAGEAEHFLTQRTQWPLSIWYLIYIETWLHNQRHIQIVRNVMNDHPYVFPRPIE
nr:hypothetical protein CFP56_78117 [Quercus suber]